MNNHSAYTSGIKSEQGLIGYLKENGYRITPSTVRENCEQDIDCYWEDIPVSIKTQHTCLRTGNVCFELELTTRSGDKELGWFRSGEAKLYWIMVGRQLYSVKKSLIAEYVLRYGWHRQAHLSFEKKQSQERIGHKHIDSVVGLIPLERLLEEGVAEWVCQVPTCVAFPSRYS